MLGKVQGGCFGYAGPPDTWTVQVSASRGGSVAGKTTLTEKKSDTTGGPYTMLGDTYRFTLPPGTYTIAASARGLGDGSPLEQGTVEVRSGQEVMGPVRSMGSCS